MLTDNTSLTFDPDAHVSEYFTVKLKTGRVAGRYLTYLWDKLQLKSVKDAQVATSEGREMTFRNTGKATIILE